MKKPILMLFLLIALTACHNENENKFNQIKPGMQSKKVIALVGDPETKTPMFIAEWWSYTKDNKLIVMANDTVVRVVMDLKAAQDSMKKIGTDVKQKMDSLSDALKTDSTK